ncbi:hypothetical protein LEP1GSC169_1896 [Leptospira santarosai str. HAI1349]|nr:hypothetical protein LEP1GSC169_1896 [Leptospira santarosai str. HAI1349]EMM84887.1 hypothetical protein LEP1GSC039_0427 [Leptospira santarosai str. 2000027870]
MAFESNSNLRSNISFYSNKVSKEVRKEILEYSLIYPNHRCLKVA